MIIGFFDESAPQTTANTARLWSFRKPVIIKNIKKFRANTFVFYTIKGNSVIDFPKHSMKEDAIAFPEKIRLNNPDGRIMIMLDNFKSYYSLNVAKKAFELGIDLICLPPYSPDLNPIEFIWKSIKRIISRSFIDSRESMCSLIENAFLSLSKSKSYATSWISKFLQAEIQESING